MKNLTSKVQIFLLVTTITHNFSRISLYQFILRILSLLNLTVLAIVLISETMKLTLHGMFFQHRFIR